MQRDYRHFIQDIADAISKIERYIGDSDFEQFSSDEKLVDAVVRNLEIIGEAAKKIPPEIREKHPDVEWKKACAFRDVLAHSYFGIDLEIVWDIVRNKIPTLKKNILAILNGSD